MPQSDAPDASLDQWPGSDYVVTGVFSAVGPDGSEHVVTVSQWCHRLVSVRGPCSLRWGEPQYALLDGRPLSRDGDEFLWWGGPLVLVGRDVPKARE